jgi:aspartate/methionine/tyrosine aminotransferase
VEAVQNALTSYKANGYTPTEGAVAAREAVAELYSSEEFKLTADDVFLSNGASGAIWLAIGALCPRGSNVLFPRPGFTYCVASDPMGVEKRFYNCRVYLLWTRLT